MTASDWTSEPIQEFSPFAAGPNGIRRFLDRTGLWKTGDHCTCHLGRDQVTQPLTCHCTRTSVIEEGDRISARFTYNGTFNKAFMGYQPNGTPDQMRSSDIWRVKDGKLIEHWDELNPLEVFQQIGAATVRKAEGQ